MSSIATKEDNINKDNIVSLTERQTGRHTKREAERQIDKDRQLHT